jgi:hypothetical protein
MRARLPVGGSGFTYGPPCGIFVCSHFATSGIIGSARGHTVQAIKWHANCVLVATFRQRPQAVGNQHATTQTSIELGPSFIDR